MHGVGPGSLLGGRYLVQRRVSQHSRYERWSAADQTLDREVILLCCDVDGPVASAALDAARRAAGVEESRLVRVLDVGRDDGVAFVVEEPLTGARSLTAVLTDGGLPSEEARRVVGEAAAALERARARGLHHGVLTPRSVFRLGDGSIKVRGLATEAALVDADDSPPDEATRADTVALVALGYALLTGRWPLTGPDSGLEAAPRVVGGVAAPSEIAAGVPADLDLLARTTLNEDHGPRTPGELAQQIGPWSPTPVSGALDVPSERRTPGSRTEPLARDRTTGGLAHEPARPFRGRRGGGAASVGLGALTGSATARAGSGVAGSGVAASGAAGSRAAGSGVAGSGSSDAGASGSAVEPAGAAASAGPEGPVARAGSSERSSLRSVLGMTFGINRAEEDPDEAGDPAHDPAHGGAHDGGERSDAYETGLDVLPPGDEDYGPYEEGEEGFDDGTRPRSRPAVVAGAAAAGAAAGSAVARGLGSAIGAAGGLASTVGDKVGGMARGAADRAAERSATRAERQQTERYEDPIFFGDQVRLSETLQPTDERLEPALPLLPGAAQEPLDRDQSRLVLIGLVVFVLVAAALGIWGLPRLTGLDVPSASPVPVVTKTVTASPSDAAAAAPPTSAPPTSATSAPPAQPIPVVAASQISEDGGVQASRTAAAAYDGDPETFWRSSKYYATAAYGGYQGTVTGLLLDLGQPVDVHQVTFRLRGAAAVSVLVTDTPKATGANTIGSVTGQDGEVAVSVPNGGAVKGRYVILWFTTLGPDGEGRFRAQVAEVGVR